MTLPTTDLLLHNLLGVGVAVVTLMLLAQLVRAVILGASKRLLSFAAFEKITPADRDAFQRRLGRITLVTVALLSAGFVAAGLLGTYLGIRALTVAQAGLVQLRAQDFASFNARLLRAAGVVVGAIFIDAVARAIISGIGGVLVRAARLAARRDTFAEIIARLRASARIIVLCVAAVLIASALDLSPRVLRGISLAAYVLVAFYTSGFIVHVARLLVDLLFDSSGKLAKLESPLKYLGNLTHLVGITKRAVDYFVFVGAATLVADEFSPDTWLAQAGRIGIRVIAIFYMSRVMVEVCILFLNELFITKAPEEAATNLQRRKTLVPVAEGLLRYGIYFSAIIMALKEASIDPTPLLAGAGVLGVALGLGAQAFVGDIVAGFFILFENLLLVGDLVEVSSVKGKVEEIGVRITKIRDDAGVLHAIPNGEVRKVANHSKAYVNAVIDVFVPYEEDVRRVRALLLSITEQAMESLTGACGPVEVKVQELSEGSVMLRVICRVPPGQDEDLGDELRARILDELRDAKIGAPRMRRAFLIDGGIGIAPPAEKKGEAEEESGPPKPFAPPEPSD
ncbi:MAG: mechanosensitive ion channel family protein [Byssovorax sp.]